MARQSSHLRTFGATLAWVPLWLLASCGGGGGTTDSGTLVVASLAETVSVQAQGGGHRNDGHGTLGGADGHHGHGDHDDGDDCDRHGRGGHGGDHGNGDHGGKGDRHARGGGSDEGGRWHDASDDDHGKHRGRGRCKPPKPVDLPQLPPAQPAPLPVSCEQLAVTLAVPAAPAAPFDGRASALGVKPAAAIAPAAAASGTPVPGPIPDTVITTTTTVPPGTLTVGGQPVAEHCVVTGRMLERVSPVDGKPYAIGFQMRLPKAWNGRFWYQANGGIDGNVSTASGTFGGGPLTSALLQGFAVLSSDAGHSAADGPFFGIDPQARLDYGYQAVGKLTPMAKKLIELAYGKGPDRSYIGGCSNGGRHTLVAAARYAADYDGFLAGAPGFNLPLAALANIFGAQRYATIATGDPATPPGLETAFTAAERATVASAVLERCDALDGVTDGLVQDTGACQRRFSLFRHVPTCGGARDGTCLTLAQKIAIAPIFRGATLANGERFYAPFPYDSGLSGGGIPFWEFTAPLVLDSGAVGLIFGVPPALPEPPAPFNGPAFALGGNIDALHASLFATNATYTESAMGFMTPPNPTDMSAVRNRGGKILVYHGVSDPIFSVADTAAWYDGVEQTSGGDAGNFARLFRVPGMGHCAGGPSTDQFDVITPLVAWVEQGTAPRRIVATARGVGNPGGVNLEVPAAWAADRTRPLCPYPAVARYRGFGDVEAASSWRCR